MNWRAWWARLSARERTLIGAAAGVLVLAVLRFALVSPFLAYRESLRDEIVSHRELLENDHAYLARAGEVTKHLELLRARFAEVRGQLVPGDTPTLAAANLQDMLHSVAAEKDISIQSTQVMREETVGDFRRIGVRITVTGELRPLADFLSAVEFGSRRVALPYVEISRRGAVLRGQGSRALAATVEVNAFIQGTEPQAAKAELAAGAANEPAASPVGEGATPAAVGSPAATPEAAASAGGTVPSAGVTGVTETPAAPPPAPVGAGAAVRPHWAPAASRAVAAMARPPGWA